MAAETTFPAALRVKHGAHFERAYRLQRRRDGGCIVVYAAPNGTKNPRLGISASRKVGSAVERNAFKRRLREAFRLEQSALPAGMDLVVVVRPHALRTVRDYRGLLVRFAKELSASGGAGRTGS